MLARHPAAVVSKAEEQKNQLRTKTKPNQLRTKDRWVVGEDILGGISIT